MDNIVDPSRFNRGAFPYLASFMRGYLHEDFAQEHGTALAAARNFVRVASSHDLTDVAGDATRFVSLTALLPMADIRAQVVGLGAAWRPRTRADFERVLTALCASTSADPPGPLRTLPT